VIRGALVDATNGLSTTRADMERHFQDNRTYASVGGFTSPCLRAGGIAFGDFTITCSVAPTDRVYTLSASGNPGTNVAGFTFTVDQIDQRTTVAPTGWPSCNRRWLTKKGATC
jgi:type IV pilus assembly protein PilE